MKVILREGLLFHSVLGCIQKIHSDCDVLRKVAINYPVSTIFGNNID